MHDLTVTQAATALGRSKEHIRKLVFQKKLLRGQRIDGRTYLIDAHSFAALLDARAAAGLHRAGKEAA